MKQAYILLCGLPGSGKTTLRREIANRWNRAEFGFITQLSTDDMIERFGADNGLTYTQAFSKENMNTASHVVGKMRHDALQPPMSIIHDQTNTAPNKRHLTMLDVPTEHYVRICIVVKCDEGLRQARLSNRPGKVIPPEVDFNMRRMWQDPQLREGFDMIFPSYLTGRLLKPWLRRGDLDD